ncbi:checkpoint protein HUS1 isoform X2 [Dermacentor albipictus]|uniref:checkpoint protein HUS1 isoform X2 n=1 Tax=Dermacentor albipictus TaxID=60249 RepID=UPI0038FCC54F
MKFRGRIVDIVCIQQLSKIVHTVSKLAKDVTLRITTDCVYFILNEDAVSGGGWLWADIPQETLFQEYNMQGVSEEFNEIYLDVVADHIVKALKSAAAAKSLKVKLTKRQTPCLSFEIELPSLVSTSRTVVHDVPVSVIPRRLWNNFAQPDVEEGDTITISSDHGMTVSVQTDMVTVTTHFKGLQFPLSRDGTVSHDGVYEARIDLRKLVPVLLAQQLNPRQVTCRDFSACRALPFQNIVRLICQGRVHAPSRHEKGRLRHAIKLVQEAPVWLQDRMAYSVEP